MPVEAETEKAINSLRSRISRTEHSLDDLKQREDAIRAVFLKELERYRYLQDGGAPGSYPDAQVEAASGS
jgi:hypothetical protein